MVFLYSHSPIEVEQEENIGIGTHFEPLGGKREGWGDQGPHWRSPNVVEGLGLELGSLVGVSHSSR